MELHKAIKSIIDTDGVDVIKDTKMVNILGDLRAFDLIPASKYILRAIIADGYAQKLLAIGTWNDESERLCNQFILTTGFQNDYALIVFQSLAFGLGYINTLTSTKNKSTLPNLNNNPVKSQAGQLLLKHEELLKLDDESMFKYKDMAEDYLNKLIEIKGNWKKELGVDVKASCIYEIYHNCSQVVVALEINGKISIKYECIRFHAIFYDAKGKILQIKIEDKYNTKKAFEVITIEPIDDDYYKYIGNINKIVVYYDKQY